MPQRVKSGRELPKREFAKIPGQSFAVCKKCHALYSGKRWFYDENLYKEMIKKKPPLILCPGCQGVEQKRVDGIVNLKSFLLKDHKDEVINLIRHEEERAKEKNPLSRIVEIRTRGEEIEINTTTQFLATRIGHALEKAYSGKLGISKLPRESFVRVNWVREE